MKLGGHGGVPCNRPSKRGPPAGSCTTWCLDHQGNRKDGGGGRCAPLCCKESNPNGPHTSKSLNKIYLMYFRY